MQVRLHSAIVDCKNKHADFRIPGMTLTDKREERARLCDCPVAVHEYDYQVSATGARKSFDALYVNLLDYHPRYIPTLEQPAVTTATERTNAT